MATRPVLANLPPVLDRLYLCLRSDMGVTLNGSNVSAWADQSGRDNHATQATANKQPAYVTNQKNGLPAIRFDGAATFLSLPGGWDRWNGISVYAVLKRSASGNFRDLLDITSSTGTADEINWQEGASAGNSADFVVRDAAGFSDVPTTAWAPGSYVVSEVAVTQTGASNWYENEVSANTNTFSHFPANVYRPYAVIGANSQGSGAYFQVDLFALLIYGVGHTRREMTKVATWLNGIYAVY